MNILTITGHAANIIGVLGAIAAFLAWRNTRKIRRETNNEKERQNQKVKIFLKNYDTGKKVKLPVELSRGEFSRAELLGLIGMVPMKEKQKRFSINHLGEEEFFQKLHQITTGSGEYDLYIPCTENEINQFDLK